MAGPTEPWELVGQERTRHFASPGAAMELRNPPQPELQERVASAHALPRFPRGPAEQLEPPREADSSRLSDTSTTYKTRGLSDVP